jgi:hypothetical protein
MCARGQVAARLTLSEREQLIGLLALVGYGGDAAVPVALSHAK